MANIKDILNTDKPVLLDFHATWCGPCQTMHPVIDDIKNEFGDKIRILKIDVDKNNALAAKYKIRSVPTFILFKNGEIEWKAAGISTRADLRKVINKVLA